MSKTKSHFKKIYNIFLYIFAIAGVIFIGVYFAMKFGLLNVKGSASDRNSYFFNSKKGFLSNRENASDDLIINCQVNVLGKYAPVTATNIYKSVSDGVDTDIIIQMIKVASVRFKDDKAYMKELDSCYTKNSQTITLPMSAYYWADTDEWTLMKEVFTRDQEFIKKAAHDAGISPRLLLGGVIGEQFRFFSNRRESFKGYFEPLKILASLSNTSFGIAGLKPKTVQTIENNLKDPNSPFYLGPDMEHVADYAGGYGTDDARLARITDTKNPYYTYLYVGLFMKQIQAQWQKAGYDVSNRPDVMATLYNLGFYYSVPKDNAKSGGSTITINGVDYVFGDIAYEFYYSGELSDIFPLVVE